ncbi:MAG TPA: hypothetical protein VFN30_11745 [Chitinophagaceae bacterium]|nr:hypothetical protein [Chitinophagaceae bacterium]
MQTLELEKLKLTHLQESETKEINGGLWWLPAALVIGLAISAVNNFGDIRQGFVDGWNGTPRH